MEKIIIEKHNLTPGLRKTLKLWKSCTHWFYSCTNKLLGLAKRWSKNYN